MIDSDILADVKRRYDEVTALMAQPDVATDSSRMAELGPEHRRLEEVVDRIERYERMLSEREELQALIDEGEDEELAAMAREELAEIERKLPEAEQKELVRELKLKWERVNEAYQKLPFTLDTPQKRARKEQLERELKQLEHDVETLQHKAVLVAEGE
jgi:protein subunit release factor A